jgi:hypothetical protein
MKVTNRSTFQDSQDSERVHKERLIVEVNVGRRKAIKTAKIIRTQQKLENIETSFFNIARKERNKEANRQLAIERKEAYLSKRRERELIRSRAKKG